MLAKTRQFHKSKNPNCSIFKQLGFCMVRLKGLEPSRPKTPDPKSGASTNSATSALADAKLVKNGETGKILCDFYDPHRPVRMLVTVGADARNDRCGWQNSTS